MKLSEIWYVDAFQQKKMLQNKFFWISTSLAFLWPFFCQKLTKNKVIWQNPNR